MLPGVLHELTGCTDTMFFHGLPYPDSPHFTVFDYESCMIAYRNPDVFASSPEPIDLDNGPLGLTNSMLSMGGEQHKRYRALVQPSFLPANGKWWIGQLDLRDRGLAHRRVGARRARRTQRRLLRGHPRAHHYRQFRRARRAGARYPAIPRDRSAEGGRPTQADRRGSPREPKDDLISVLVQAELTDDDGVTDRLTDREIDSFVLLLLGAGSGTTWKQMGTTFTALLQRPELLEAVRADRQLLRPAIEEAIRWMPTDPMFSRWVMADTELGGVEIPAGSVVHLAIGAANRDPARWDRPDEFDITRKFRPSLGFGQGVHICLGMHVARAEMTIAISALLDRLPNLRLDPDAEPPRFVGMYERGATAIPVLFDKA